VLRRRLLLHINFLEKNKQNLHFGVAPILLFVFVGVHLAYHAFGTCVREAALLECVSVPEAALLECVSVRTMFV